MKNLNWDDLRVFRAIAAYPSLRSASKVLGMSGPTLARRVERLERELGGKLFAKSQAGYDLTKFGSEVLQRTRGMDSAVADLAAWNDRVHTLPLITLCAPDEILWFQARALPRLWTPKDSFRISFERASDIGVAETDRATLRITSERPASGNVKSKRLKPLSFGVYSAADFNLADDCNWATMRLNSPHSLLYDPVPQDDDPWATVWASDFATFVSLIEGGAGRAVLPDQVAASSPHLSRIDDGQQPDIPLFCVSHFEADQFAHAKLAKARVIDVLGE